MMVVGGAVDPMVLGMMPHLVGCRKHGCCNRQQQKCSDDEQKYAPHDLSLRSKRILLNRPQITAFGKVFGVGYAGSLFWLR